MPNRERADILKKEIDTIYEESFELQAKAAKVIEARDATLGDIIKEEKLLAKRPWRYDGCTSMNLNLTAIGIEDDFPEVVELLEPGHHANFCLGSHEDGPRLCFSDGVMYLRFDRDTAKETIEAFGLTIDLGNLTEKQKRQQKDLLELEGLITVMKGIVGDE